MSPKLSEIAWDVPPPPAEEMYLPILSPKPGVKLLCVAVGERICGVHVHFLNDRTFPHMMDATKCNGCCQGQRPRWKGYLQVLNLKDNKQGLLELTPNAVRCLPQDYNLEAYNWRGTRLETYRKGNGANGRVQLQLLGWSADEVKGLRVLDVRLALLRIWGKLAMLDAAVSGEQLPDGSPVI